MTDDEIRADRSGIKIAQGPRPRRPDLRRGVLAWLLIMSLISPMIVAGFSVVYTEHVRQSTEMRLRDDSRRDNRQWCQVLKLLDVPSSVTDPVERARDDQFRAEFHQLRVSKGCITR